MTLSTLNKTAKAYGLELVKGQGYFYWVSATADLPSVYVSAFTHLSADQWRAELQSAITLKGTP